MRPPEFTGGNTADGWRYRFAANGFNEAAGIHRRKRASVRLRLLMAHPRFNEAAGIHRRKHHRQHSARSRTPPASMRPPEFTGGNIIANIQHVAVLHQLQ